MKLINDFKEAMDQKIVMSMFGLIMVISYACLATMAYATIHPVDITGEYLTWRVIFYIIASLICLVCWVKDAEKQKEK